MASVYPGRVIGDRFEIERLVGAGAMGRVFLAADRQTGQPVALKLLGAEAQGSGVRFAREAAVLAELRHPAIVRHVAHGVCVAGELYLAMEWLDGEDLATRLARGPLSVSEGVRLLLRMAEALAEAHGRGLVHRDVKPSNIFLPARNIEQAKLVDFGIVRVKELGGPQTQAGVVLGTPGYMSPEQARGERTLDARADVFALGCVVHEALAGRPAFGPPDLGSEASPSELVLATLAKVLFDEPPELFRVRPDVPEALSLLVSAMLAKRPGQRPASGAGVIAALSAVTAGVRTPPPAPERLSAEELRRLFVVVAWSGVPSGPELWPAIEALGATHEARVERVMDGSVVATVNAAGSATDGAARAARCALALSRLMPAAAMALATGRGAVTNRVPVGEVIDRAAALVRAARRWRRAPGKPAIFLDEVVASLLGPGFVVEGEAPGLRLTGEQQAETPRTLLGRPSPCVGRDRELALLHGTFAACASDSQARAVLVTAPPGIGKSRLRAEFVGQLGNAGRPLQILMGAAEKLAAGSPFALLGQLLRRTAGIHGGESLELRRRRLQTRVARNVDPPDRERVAVFLGELAGVPFPDQDSVVLAAARRDPQVMADQTRAAWETFLRAECRAHPVIVVLEDLHWGDLPTVAHLDWALARLEDEPLFVLALARPVVHEQFRDLWRQRRFEELPLGRLSRRACERLVHHALGSDVSAETSNRVVSLADGNAFYLEELIRAVAEGRSRLPESVLAMAQSRYEALAAQARQMLRAAAILGEVFWRGAVGYLVPHLAGAEGERWLEWLVDRELLERRSDCRFQGETEYAFRHAFVREAAYAALTDADRARGHRLATDWLERAGETDAMTLAEHLELAGEPGRAVAWYQRGAEHALEGGDFAAAQARVHRALSCGATAEQRVALFVVDLEALKWQGQYAAMVERAGEILSIVPPGSAAWLRVLSDLSRRLPGQADPLPQIEHDLAELVVQPAQARDFIVCAARVLTRSYVRRRSDQVARLRQKVEDLATVTMSDPILEGWLNQARAFHAGVVGRLGDGLRLIASSRAGFLAGGDRRNAFAQLVDEGYVLLEVGLHDRARGLISEALPEMTALGLTRLLPHAQVVLATAQLRLADLDAAVATCRLAEQAFLRESHFNHVRCLQVLARAHLLSGDLAEAERVARRAVAIADQMAGPFFDPRPMLAEVLLAARRCQEALDLVQHPTPRVVFSDSEGGAVAQRLLLAEALWELGRREDARAAIADARRFVCDIADNIEEQPLRTSFLERVPDVARILKRAEEFNEQR